MITNFKVFENVESETTLILNDLMIYYNRSQTKIKKFITDLLAPGKVVKFNFNYGYDNSTFNFIPEVDEYTGIVDHVHDCTIGYKGTPQRKEKEFVILSLILKNDPNIEYRINVNSSFTIYGDITETQKNIIDKLKLIGNMSKFNL